MFRNHVKLIALSTIFASSIGTAAFALPATGSPEFAPASAIVATTVTVAPATPSTTVAVVAEQPAPTVVETSTSVPPVTEAPKVVTAPPAIKSNPAPVVSSPVASTPATPAVEQAPPVVEDDPLIPIGDGFYKCPSCTTNADAKWYRMLDGYCMSSSAGGSIYAIDAPECETDKTPQPRPYKVVDASGNTLVEYPQGNPAAPPTYGTIVLL